MRVAYFTNLYPAVCHTFIRREIRALEALGISVQRYALRCDRDIVDPEDRSEFQQTSYILKNFPSQVIRCLLPQLFLRPITLLRVLRSAVAMGWRSERGMLRHFFYVAEALVLGSWCKRDRIQHLHAHFGTNPAVVAMFASQLTGIPYSFTVHGSDEFENAPLLSLGEKLEASTFAVSVSYYGRAQLMRWSSPSQWSKVAVVHCGVDESFLGRPIRPIPSTPSFVCVGRLDKWKAQLVLLAAARRLHLAGVDFKIVLAGDGPMRTAVEQAIFHYGLQKEVSVAGWVSGDRVKAEIEASRALILPSFSENMPVVIMEALALGRPVISTYVAGIPELVSPGETGWLVPASDDSALAHAMLEVLDATPDKLAAMGIRGRSKVANEHSATAEARKLKILFEGGSLPQEAYATQAAREIGMPAEEVHF